MKIITLKDVKDALKDVPDKLLDSLSFGTGEGCEDLISMCASEGMDEYDYPQVFDLINKKYPALNDVNKLIQNIAKSQVKLEDNSADDDYLEEISSTDKI